MGVTYTGCKEAKEISLCRAGANPGAFVLMTKNNKPTRPQNPRHAQQTEPTDMDLAKIAKALAGMDEITKAYMTHLPDDKALEFMGKLPADQKKEAADAKKKADEAILAEKALAEGKSIREVELEKSNKDMSARLEAIEKARADDQQTAAIEKRAREEFAGLPGDDITDPKDATKTIARSGQDRAVAMLKAASKLSPDERDGIEAILKSQAQFARRAGSQFSVVKSESPGGGAAAQIEAEVNKRMTEKKITKSQAVIEVAADPKFADLQERALEEEAA